MSINKSNNIRSPFVRANRDPLKEPREVSIANLNNKASLNLGQELIN